MKAEVSLLLAQDLAEAVALDLQIFGGWWSWQSYQQELQRSSSSLLGLRLLSKSSNWETRPGLRQGSSLLVGLSCLWRVLDEAHITMLGIHPQYQRQGLGQALLLALLTVAHQHQSTRATLEVQETNQPAVSLYQKFGFKTAGRRSHYYGEGEDALILWQGNLQTLQFQQSLAVWQRETEHRLAMWGCQGLRLMWDESNASA